MPKLNGVWLHSSTDMDPKILALARRAEKWFMDKGFIGYKILNPWYPCVVAWEEGKPVGIAVYHVIGNWVEVLIIYVIPSRRGKGLLRTLVNQVPVDKPLTWGVHPTNVRAINAYLKLGATLRLFRGHEQITCTYDRRALGVYK